MGSENKQGDALVLMGGTRGDPHDGAGLGDRVVPMLETCRLCEEQELHYALSVAFGEPGETRATVEEKLDFLRSIKPAIANLRLGVNILPGTPIATRALAEGRITDEAALIKPTFYLAESVQDWVVILAVERYGLLGEECLAELHGLGQACEALARRVE